MRTRELKALKTGQRVNVTGTMDGKGFVNEKGVVVSLDWIDCNDRVIQFDKWREGWYKDGRATPKDCWRFSLAQARKFNITVIPEAPKSCTLATAPFVAPKKRPHGKQEYKGNGKHEWERVTEYTTRLRVPGGWLYKYSTSTTFVPVPAVVGYAV